MKGCKPLAKGTGTWSEFISVLKINLILELDNKESLVTQFISTKMPNCAEII